jgi:hypothetical protein
LGIIGIYQHFPFYGPPKFTQIGIFGFKMNHLATLNGTPSQFSRSFSFHVLDQNKTLAGPKIISILKTRSDICSAIEQIILNNFCKEFPEKKDTRVFLKGLASSPFLLFFVCQ